GKGLASALVGASFRSAFRAMVHADLSLLEIATKMNLLHYGEGDEARRRYVTAMLLRLDPAALTLEVANAGHNPAFLASGGTLNKIAASGPPIGFLPFPPYAAGNFAFGPGARLLVKVELP